MNFDSLPLVTEGESKIIRYMGNGIVAIKYKPTIYSFTHNRTGVIEGTEKLRMRASQIFTQVLRQLGVDHAYLGMHDDLMIAEFIPDSRPDTFHPDDVLEYDDVISPLEVVCKDYHVGTPKHRYYQFDQYPTRFGFPVVKPGTKYRETVVRFDWRNPLHDDKGNRLADEAMPECMANWYIDTKRATRTATFAFDVLKMFLKKRDIEIQDICFLMNQSGNKIISEISQDCGRYVYKGGESLDKDIWRSGGSSEVVAEKWAKILELIEDDTFTMEPVVLLEGNDGVGKSTLAKSLTSLGYNVQDRGFLTMYSEDPKQKYIKEAYRAGHVTTFVLDCKVETSRARLYEAGKDLNEKFHTEASLHEYREKFLKFQKLFPNCHLINAEFSAQTVLNSVLAVLKGQNAT